MKRTQVSAGHREWHMRCCDWCDWCDWCSFNTCPPVRSERGWRRGSQGPILPSKGVRRVGKGICLLRSPCSMSHDSSSCHG